MNNKPSAIKLALIALFFLAGMAFAAWALYHEHEKTGCWYMVQDVNAKFEVPIGKTVRADEIKYEYSCEWSPRGFIMLLGAGAIGLGIALDAARKQRAALEAAKKSHGKSKKARSS